jgi:ABC-type uncharacterized transport system fused permease/ATPase subunit
VEEQHPAEVPDGAESEIPQSPEAEQGSRYVRRAWLMLPLLLVSMLAAVAYAVIISSLAGIDPIDPLAEQGLLGWVVFIGANLVLWPLPSYFGIKFALQARQLGANAFVPLVAHCFIVAVIWSLALLEVISEF